MRSNTDLRLEAPNFLILGVLVEINKLINFVFDVLNLRSGLSYTLFILIFAAVSVSAEPVYHGLYTAPFDRFVNLRLYNNSQNPIVFHGANRSYYQKIEGPINGVYYMYYSDANTTGGATYMAVANSTDGDHWKFVRYSKTTGHPYVLYNQGGFPGLNNDHIYFIWDQLTVGHGAYLKEIRVYYSNTSDGTGLKDMGWLNMTWTVGASNNGTIAGTNGFNKIFYNASGSGGHSRNPFDYKFAIFYDCIGQSAENFCVVGTDDPLKINRSSLHKVILNQTGANWDALKTGFGDIVRYKGYYLAWYEGGKTSTREALGLAYSLNGSGGFVKMSQNPILKKSSNKYMNKSVGGASIKIEGNVARLYVAGMNFTKSSTYQIVEYIYDIRNDKNVTITGVSGASSQIMNRTNGVLYNYNASNDGDKVLILTGLKYNIKVKPDAKNSILINGLNGTNARDMEIKVQVASTKPSGIQSFSSVIYSNATGFDVATLYFNKSVIPDKVCSCANWNTGTTVCDSAWVCNVTSDYQHGSNSTQYWINVTHFSGYGIGNDSVYSAPSIISVIANSSSVLQGRNVSVDVDVSKGVNDLGSVWFDYNGTSASVVPAVNGSNSLLFSTVGKLGSYVITGHVNDSNSTARSMVGPSVNIYTTTTTGSTSSTTSTTTTTTTTTTTIIGSANIHVNNKTNTFMTGANVVVTSSNGTVIENHTINATTPIANTSVLHDASNYKITISLPNNDSLIFSNYSFTKINKSFVIQNTNFIGSTPATVRRIVSDVFASNISNSVIATLVFNTPSSPTRLCSCISWDYNAASCSGSWVCYDVKSYAHSYRGSIFKINVTHFSAYVVGISESMRIWDDTNDPQGQYIKHYQNQSVGFFANYTNATGFSIDGGTAYCQYMENSAGTWSAKVNMTYNLTNKLYYTYRSFGNYGNFNFNITCFSSTYNSLSAVDGFAISREWQTSNAWSQVYWWTAEVVAHSLSYGIYNASIACDQTHLFYVDGVTGSLKKINASSDRTGVYKCQNSTQGAFVLQNDGSVPINVSASFDQVTSGVIMKLGNSNSGWQLVCSGTCGSGGCDLSTSCIVVNVSSVLISHALPQNVSKEYWMWADFNHVAGTIDPTKGNMTTDAVKS